MLYDIAFLIFSLIYLPTLLFKGKLHRNFLERFGIYDKDKEGLLASGTDKIWVQAVSVGEVSLCRKLVTLLRERFPGHQIVFSTVTKSGNGLAKKLFAKDAIIIYFPLDLSFIVKRAISLIRPRLYIMIETEIWPNVIRRLSSSGIPSVLINGRISDRSFGGYKLARPFLKNILEKISLFCVRFKGDAERFSCLGAPQKRIRITGNMKFDMDLKSDEGSMQKMRELLGLKTDDELFVAGSIHEGEELALIEVFRELIIEFPRLKLLLAPRRVENFLYFESIIKELEFEPVLVSRLREGQYPAEDRKGIFILDTIGDLRDLYSIATLVFIGGSLVRHGGQNPMEPAIFGKAILFGPHMSNFKDDASLFLKGDAAIQITGKEDLLEKVRYLLRNEEARIRLGQNAKNVLLRNSGATERNIEAICETLFTH